MKSSLGFLIIIGLLLALSLPTTVAAQEAPTPEPVGLRPDAPTYALHGPYWVGTREFVIGEGSDRPLQTHVWYPALNPDGVAESISYNAIWKDPTLPTDITAHAVVYGHAILDAGVDTRSAPYPLIVFSHGFGAPAHIYAPMLEHWASYGFVVLAPEHLEHYDAGFTEIWESSIERPRDITQVLDYAETMTAAGGSMEGLIDMERVTVAGQSYGGYTALAAGGARYDLTAFNARCAALAPDDPAQFLCMPLVPYEADMAALAGFDSMPEGLWPSLGDPRVDAIVPMASDSYLFDQAGLAAITIPMMALGGTMDVGTPFDWGVAPAYQYGSSETKALIAFENADHMIFGATCSDIPEVDGDPFSYWICMDQVWDKERAHDLINHFTTAFLLDVLKGDQEAHAALAPDAMSFPGIEYQAQGF